MPVRLSVRCSILLSFRKLLPAVFWFFTDSFPVYQNPEIYFQKRTARLSPAVQVREETPWGAATAGSSRRSCFADKKGPRIDRAQSLLCSRYIYAVDASYRDADHVGGRPHDSRIN